MASTDNGPTTGEMAGHDNLKSANSTKALKPVIMTDQDHQDHARLRLRPNMKNIRRKVVGVDKVLPTKYGHSGQTLSLNCGHRQFRRCAFWIKAPKTTICNQCTREANNLCQLNSPSTLVLDLVSSADTAADPAPAPTGRGTLPSTNAPTLPMTTDAPSTTTSLPALRPSGGSHLLSEQAAALQAIPTELGCSPSSVMVLCAMYMGLLRTTLSEDSFYLAMRSGQKTCLDAGVSAEEFERVKKVIHGYWSREREKHPLRHMYT